MDPATYHRWWAVHLRWALGQTLTPEEQAFYDVGCRELDEGEVLRDNAEEVREARRRIEALEAEQAALDVKRQQLMQEIAALETALRQCESRHAAVGG